MIIIVTFVDEGNERRRMRLSALAMTDNTMRGITRIFAAEFPVKASSRQTHRP